jgi:hypothetical protein
MSLSIGKLAAALSKVQSQLKSAAKDSANPFFKSKYADLGSVWDACREALGANEFAVSQSAGSTPEGGISITTILMHSSGEWVGSEVAVKPTKAGPQEAGSILSYLRRYSLAALVGVVAEDDDGEAAEGRGAERGKPAAKGRKPAPQVEEIPPNDPAVLDWFKQIDAAPDKGAAMRVAAEISKWAPLAAPSLVAQVKDHYKKHIERLNTFAQG